MVMLAVIGVAMILATVVVESCFIAVAVAVLNRSGETLAQMGNFARTVVTLSGLSLWLLTGIALALCLWASLLVSLDQFDSFARALYYSSVSATTLGYGDVLLSERWQLLSGFIAANGLVLFSLNTAFLFEALRRLGDAYER